MPRQPRAIAGAVRGLSQPGDGPVSLTRRGALAVDLTALFVWLLVQRLQGVAAKDVWQVFGAVPLSAWVLALAATAISFWAVGRYDEVAHRHLASAVPPGQARMAGVCAIALSQVLGLGVVTGALVRWRMLPSLTALAAGRLTLVVSAMFLAGWAVVTAAAVLLLGGPGLPMAAVVLIVALAAAAVPLVAPPARLAQSGHHRAPCGFGGGGLWRGGLGLLVPLGRGGALGAGSAGGSDRLGRGAVVGRAGRGWRV